MHTTSSLYWFSGCIRRRYLFSSVLSVLPNTLLIFYLFQPPAVNPMLTHVYLEVRDTNDQVGLYRGLPLFPDPASLSSWNKGLFPNLEALWFLYHFPCLKFILPSPPTSIYQIWWNTSLNIISSKDFSDSLFLSSVYTVPPALSPLILISLALFLPLMWTLLLESKDFITLNPPHLRSEPPMSALSEVSLFEAAQQAQSSCSICFDLPYTPVPCVVLIMQLLWDCCIVLCFE